ncbi:unnamed protein product [Prunus brigantina]
MVLKSQTKEAQVSKGQSKDIVVSKAQMSEAKSVQSNPAKKMRFSSSSENDPSFATFDEETDRTRPEFFTKPETNPAETPTSHSCRYNKNGIPLGKAAIEMQRYIGVLARTKDLKEHIWEAVQMAYVVGGRGQEFGIVVCHQKMEGFQVYLN